MSVTPQDFIGLANRLVGQKHEIDRRAAASRAYYGAFHQSLMVLGHSTKSVDAAPKDSHKSVIDGLRDARIEGLHPVAQRSASALLGQIKGLRVRADYHVRDNFDQEDAETAIDVAEDIIAQLTFEA